MQQRKLELIQQHLNQLYEFEKNQYEKLNQNPILYGQLTFLLIKIFENLNLSVEDGPELLSAHFNFSPVTSPWRWYLIFSKEWGHIKEWGQAQFIDLFKFF
jgi:hypothetical protein